MLRNILAVIAGYLAASILDVVLIVFILLFQRKLPQASSVQLHLLLILIIALIAGIAGYVAEVIARQKEMLSAFLLGFVFLISAVLTPGLSFQPTGELFLSGFLQLAGAVGGGYVRKRFRANNKPELK